MKTLLTVALASVFTFSSFIASASEDLRSLSTVNAKDKKINVTLNEGVGTAKISILSPEGKLLSNRKVRVKNENLLVPYNMENMPAGEYQVKIITDQEEVIYKVATTAKPEAAALPLMAYGKTIDENTVRLTVVGLLEPGVEVEVYSNDSGKVIHSEHIDQNEGFIKDFSFTNFETKDIHLKVTDLKGKSKTLYF
ncbi:hypothetical protein LZF95_12710 [Algoriphagus sp. AGSA1]|uniref:hypothetical protein n=1 Tax=Algoriphagus sp. AGSA1 TaxID=2907213 RepID=UPI001F33ED4E|nr:hypothetical protein [Algoriphagus sp. AGSA1]MCE7055541.1 hypothetical protein [Algoriphagus sp. AGSA1]